MNLKRLLPLLPCALLLAGNTCAADAPSAIAAPPEFKETAVEHDGESE